jgi:hypothetical protein
MMARKWLMVSALAVLGLAAFVALSPSAAAQQQVDIQLNCDPGPAEIRPLSTPGQYSCTADAKDNTNSVSDPAEFVTATLEASDKESWMNPIISPNSLVFEYQNGEGYGTQQFTVSVALTQNAPALQSSRLSIGGSAELGGDTAREASVNPVSVTVTPGYFNLYNVRLEQKIGQGGPQDSVDYPIQIENFSNGETRFDFNRPSEDAVPAGFQAVVPEPTVLQSQATGGERTTGQVTFSVYTPYQNGYVNEIGSIQLNVDSAYAPDTSREGTSSLVTTLTQARGFYVPGPGAALASMAMLGAALSMGTVVRRD